MPSASRQMASAGSMLPSGMGNTSTSASRRHTVPTTDSIAPLASGVRRGFISRSARTSQGAMRRTSAA